MFVCVRSDEKKRWHCTEATPEEKGRRHRNGNGRLKVENSQGASGGSDATLNVLQLGLVFTDAGSDLHLSLQKRL